MSKRDYQAIARAIYQTLPYADREPGHSLAEDEEPVLDQWRMTRDAVASVLEDDNPRFDRDRFTHACETGNMGHGKRKVSQ